MIVNKSKIYLIIFIVFAVVIGGLVILLARTPMPDVDLTVLENKVLGSDFRIHFTQEESGAFIKTLKPIADKKNADTRTLSAMGIAMAVHASGNSLVNHEAKEALSYLQASLLKDSRSIDTYDGLGYVNELLGNVDEAIRAYEKALSIRESARTYAYLGRAYQLKGDENKAADMFSKALSMDGSLVSAYYFMGRSLAAFGNADHAIGAFNRAYKEAMSDGEKSKIIARVAGIYALSPDDRDKRKVFDNAKEALRLDPENSYAISIMGRNYHNLMGMSGEKDNWEENAKKAEEYANKIRTADPNETDAYEWIGLDLAVFRKYDDAIKMFNSGIKSAENAKDLSVYERDNYLSQFYLYKGMVYANNPEVDGNMDAAVKYLRLAVDLRSGFRESIRAELLKGGSGYFSKLKDSSRIQEIIMK